MSKVYLFPIIAFLLCQATFICTVLSSYLKGELNTLYISDGAQHAPESCIFGQLINVCSVLIGIVVYIRHRQIEDLIETQNEIEPFIRMRNEIALWVGLGACVGLSIAANFQESSVPIIHSIGGCIYFCFGIVYMWTQGNISYYIYEYTGSRRLAYFRLFVAFIYTYLLFMSMITSTNVVALISQSTDHSSYYYILSVFSEWFAATLFNMFLLSYFNEFKFISIDRPKLTYKLAIRP